MKKDKKKKPVEKLDLTKITKGDKSQYQCKTNIALNAINQENTGYTSKWNKVKEHILNILENMEQREKRIKTSQDANY